MSIISKTALILGTAAIAAYGVGKFTAASILTVIEIQAPPEAVWAELTSTENYTDWNPFITQMSGELIEGQRLGATLQLEGKAPMKIAPRVLVASENRELRWLGRTGFRGIFDGEHYFVLEESEQGTTVLQRRRLLGHADVYCFCLGGTGH